MSASDLLSEITASFQNEPYPGNLNIVTNNTPDYDLESLQIRNTFKMYTWQTLPDTLLQYEQGGFNFLSKAGLRYYLAAYLQFPVRDFFQSDSIPDNLIFDLTLPTEVDILLAASSTAYYHNEENTLKFNWDESYQERLRFLNQDVHRFIDRYGQFNAAQSRTILHFLEYMRAEHSKEYPNNEPSIAIERYWFQFA
jgi:hypothetical protein